ncbi:MAG: cupin domain-containing protein [Lachnospiraceae bacterium]|nr:cupin domain-containing protein [Lachnospiraceae bacterium]
MFKLNEKDKEYRHGDYGPKYLEDGPRMSFGLLQILPGQSMEGHYHQKRQEVFYVVEGTLTITVNGEDHILEEGGYIHLEPGDTHMLRNDGDVNLKIVLALAPYEEGDKVLL